MRHGRRTRKGQFKRTLEQEAAKDHEVVSIAVLRLHDLHRLDLGALHPDGRGGFASRGVGIVIVELLEPEGVDEIAFFVVGRLFAQREFGRGFLEVVVLFTGGENAFFFCVGGSQRADWDGFFGFGIK